MKKSGGALKDAINRISEKTKLSPGMLLAVFMLAAGAAVLLFGSNGAEKELSSETTTSAKTDAADYTRDLEERLVSIISAIEGAGATRVMVTLESSGEEIYLSNSDYGEDIDTSGKNSFERKDEYVIVDGSSGQEGIVVRTAEPKVRGVAVVCQGAGSDSVRARIVETVTALLDISSARVSVAKMN